MGQDEQARRATVGGASFEGHSTAAGPLSDETWPTSDASTILLLRDGPGAHDGPGAADGGLEVLLLERHLDSDFAGGALVFPGGKVDTQDRELDPSRWTGRDPAAWRERLGAASDADALGLLVAAVRETFEEANVLLATRAGRPVTDQDLEEPGFVEARRRLASREERFDWRGWLEEEDLVLDLGALAPWSWWVTPKGQHKRFDTRFFVALLPDEQSAAHDQVEITGLRWDRPQDALDAQREGRMVVIFPTRRNLSALTEHRSASDAWTAADEGRVDLRRIEPEVVIRGDEVLVQHPYEDEPEAV
jgi:8-oxo-dGTP pyrophosphatase MutT (NUDIX family)